jgi:FAD:protein FMN transferase
MPCKPEATAPGLAPVLLSAALLGALPGLHARQAGTTPDGSRPLELSDEVMGTTFSIVVHGGDRRPMETAARAALREAHRIDDVLSNYKPRSEWSEMNRRAGAGPFPVSSELFNVLSASASYSRQSGGAFDLSVGPLMRVWGFQAGEGSLPARADIEKALANVGYEHVRLDAAAGTVAFDRPGVELDPGAIGKGYAVDRMIDVLRRHGISTALVSAGGSSLYGLGAPPGHPDGWPITIRAPGSQGAAPGTIHLRNTSVSTSGSYEKFFRAGGRTYSHLMDPRTGYPARGTSSVSVVAPRALDSEAWTTSYFVNGREWTARHLQPGFRVLMCDDQEPAQCEWLR